MSLKPKGTIILLEHVKSKNKVLGFLMNLLNPIVVSLYGANINRDTARNVQMSNYTNIQINKLVMDVVLLITANPNV